MNIVLFDFDGTITSKDSFIGFIRFYQRNNLKVLGGFIILFPYFFLYFLKIISRQKLKEQVMIYFFKGTDEENFLNISQSYAEQCINKIILPSALDKIKAHKQQGDLVVIVSASLAYWLIPWCKKYDLDLIATEMEFVNKIATGKIVGQNCYGKEKVARIKAKYSIENYANIIAYGNSKGDFEMLYMANESFYKYFC